MISKSLKTFLAFLMLYSCAFFFLIHTVQPEPLNDTALTLKINEVAKKMELQTLQENDWLSLQEQLRDFRKQSAQQIQVAPLFMLYGFSMLFFLCLYLYLYRRILKPFHDLKEFSKEVSRGNFDVALSEQRGQIFGAFSWAFDTMRLELKKARDCEHQAITNTKTVIASLSHDIKTPVASIRACSEALVNGMDKTTERKERYLHTIIKKCDEVSQLTDDLFLHSLSDMEALQYHCTWINAPTYFTELLYDTAQSDDNHLIIDDTALRDLHGWIYLDQNRFMQAIQNILQNARKYSDTSIRISFHVLQNAIQFHIQDKGPGIHEEDLPFIFEKFYRGKDVENIPGAGLGLYLVKEILNHMSGSIAINNTYPGLCVTLTIPYQIEKPNQQT